MMVPSSLKQVTEEPSRPAERLGGRLIELGFVTRDQLNIGLHEQKDSGRLLGAILIELGFLDDARLAEVLADRSGYGRLDLKNTLLDPVLIRRLPKIVAERCRAVPIRLDGDYLDLAMADPYDICAIDEIRRYVPPSCTLRPLVASASDIATVLSHYGELTTTLDDILQELENGEADKLRHSSALQHPMVRLANTLLMDAVRDDASDIHLEPESSFIRVRYRVDGLLRQTRALHRVHWPALSHRLKIMAGMNIADTRSLQDGHFQLDVGGVAIDFRMAVMPVLHGENIVIRILDQRRAHLSVQQLGFTAEAQAVLKTILSRPEGMILVTGPTGSGKTTTLYSILNRLSTTDVNIMTLEEPVEYQLSLIRQTAIKEQQGLSFAEGVRGILRQDPDIIFIGEMRDHDTATMALRAAMTGHQVFSTLHCNDAVGALARLKDLGLTASSIAGHISGIIAQRLVRKLCRHCKQPRPASRDEKQLLDRHRDATPQPVKGFGEAQSPYELDSATTPVIYEAVGCEHCHHSGYRGRTSVVEILRVTSAFDELITVDASRAALLQTAKNEGLVSMAHDGIAKVLHGEISMESLRRAVDLTRAA